MLSRRRFLQWLLSLGVIGAATSAYAVIAEPLLMRRVTRYQLSPPRWPEGLKLTIAVLADLHACRPWMAIDRIHAIVAQTNSLEADLIVLLGDYVAGLRYFQSGTIEADDWAAALGNLRAPLGVHAILGNHDWWDDRRAQEDGRGPIVSRRALERAGIPVYENDAVRLTKGGYAFWLAGLGDQIAFQVSHRRFPGRPIGVDDLDATLRKVTGDGPIILLAHEPDIMPKVPDRVSLVLCGHTHGGQVRLFGHSPVVPSRYGNRYAYGHVREQCDLIVSAGLGMSMLPVRIGVPPEIVLVSLER